MSTRTFAIAFSVYTFISFIAFLIFANTIPAWIAYFLAILPTYTFCVGYTIFLAFMKPEHRIWVRKPLLLLVLVVQGLMVLSSPASCYGWKQGEACYSFVQSLFVSLFTHENLQTFEQTVTHWQTVEAVFPILIGAYILTLVIFLARLHLRPLISTP